ncbi:unnamed protein product [Effrenium voratum]|nr:unnamed protein product [Effrenium voratum]
MARGGEWDWSWSWAWESWSAGYGDHSEWHGAGRSSRARGSRRAASPRRAEPLESPQRPAEAATAEAPAVECLGMTDPSPQRPAEPATAEAPSVESAQRSAEPATAQSLSVECLGVTELSPQRPAEPVIAQALSESPQRPAEPVIAQALSEPEQAGLRELKDEEPATELPTQLESSSQSEPEVNYLEAPQSWLDGANVDALIQEFLTHSDEVIDDWEDMADDVAGGGEDASPWYNNSFLLQFRDPHASAPESGALRCQPRPKTAAPQRSPGRDLVGFVKDVSGEGFALGLSPPAAASAGFCLPNAAAGAWEKVEILPWNLLHVAGAPSWETHGALARWRLHLVDLRAKPTDFHAGNKNTLRFNDGAGCWEKVRLLPGILSLEMMLDRGLPLHVQLGKDTAEVRALVMADKVCMCVEHRRPDVGLQCLCPEALIDAAAPLPAPSQVTHWGSSAEYMASWRSAVELEAAASAAEEDDTRLLYNVEITWGERSGSFLVPSALASAHRMKLRGLIRGEDGATERSSGWLCLRKMGEETAGWCGHAGVVNAELVADDGSAQELEVSVGEEDVQIPQTMALRMSFKLVPGASDPMLWRPNQRISGYLVEFIPKSLPYSCMAVALAELSFASELLREVVLRARPPARRRQVQDEAEWHADQGRESSRSLDLKPWKLNPPQEIAVRSALEDQLSLIHGPPGTGKTTTAAALCVLYALSNLDNGEVAAVLYCTPSNDAADVACQRVADSSAKHFQALSQRRRRMVLAAGGSDDCAICFSGSCDSVTACGHHFHRLCLEKALKAGTRGCPLCRRPLRRPEGGLSALRVYSAEMERGDFPVPKRIDHPSAKPRKVRVVPEAMRPFALHWRCHGLAPGVEPTQEALETGRAYEQMMRAGLGSPAFDELRTEYYLALAASRAAELRRSDVVFATCISARRGGLSTALAGEGAPELLQVVLDEAGQAPEPEALCPMTLAKNARKLVLVGDPKQLRPIITCSAAERMGLNISLLERLSDAPWGEPKLLSLQYRMHEDLNAFPAAYFYGGRVRTDACVLARGPGLLAHPARPKAPQALLFWDADAAPEQISQVRTASSSAKSRFNPAEAARATALARALAARVGGSRVAVLTWYNAQVAQLSDALQGSGVYCGGVVSSQGNEWDYVLLSTVRSSHGGLGALEDEHLLDVALTRARRGMCVLGTASTLRRIHAWSCFLDHCESRKLVTTSQPVVL